MNQIITRTTLVFTKTIRVGDIPDNLKLLNMEPKSNRQIIYERLLPYAEKNFKKITVEMGEYQGNKMCHHNARQKVEEGKSEGVAAVLAFLDRSGVNVHYLNVTDGKYVDNTLGYLSKANTYYLVEEYTKEEVLKMDMRMSIDGMKARFLKLATENPDTEHFKPEEI